VPNSRKPTPGICAVASLLVTNALCVECIMSTTSLELDQVLDAISALEVHLRLARAWGRCPSCSKTDTAFLTVSDSAGLSPQVVKYDGPERHNGLRCAKCEKPIGVTGPRAVLRRGQTYHTACANGGSTGS
jgi:hypothetical protein